jgi:hypothetical protein
MAKRTMIWAGCKNVPIMEDTSMEDPREFELGVVRAARDTRVALKNNRSSLRAIRGSLPALLVNEYADVGKRESLVALGFDAMAISCQFRSTILPWIREI